MNLQKIEKSIKKVVAPLGQKVSRLVKESILDGVRKGIKLGKMGSWAEQLREIDKVINAGPKDTGK